MSPTSFRRIRDEEYPRQMSGGAFFNAASYGLLPKRSVDAVEEITTTRNRFEGIEDSRLGQELRRARVAVARLVNASPEEIVLSPNTSFGVNLAAAYVARQCPGTVLLCEGEFPANVAPWLAREGRGCRVERVPLGPGGLPDEAELERRLRRGGAVALALSAVQFHTGYLADLERLGAICREAGAVFAVDGIQALGAVPVDVEAMGIDVLSSGGQKWLCSPWGSGFTYVHPKLLERMEPPMVSWLAFEGTRDFGGVLGHLGPLLPDGRRLELATLGIQDYAGLARSVELILELGVSRIREHIFDLHEPVERLCRDRSEVVSVTPLDHGKRGGILALQLPDAGTALQALREAGFVVVVREGLLRLAPHFYNVREEMEGAVEVLEAALS